MPSFCIKENTFRANKRENDLESVWTFTHSWITVSGIKNQTYEPDQSLENYHRFWFAG